MKNLKNKIFQASTGILKYYAVATTLGTACFKKPFQFET